MLRRLVPCCALTLAAVAGAPAAAGAQAVIGIGDDALTLPAGVLRVRAIYQVADFDQRYGLNTPGRPAGALEPLAIDFNLDTVGVLVFPNLAPLQAGLRQVSGIPEFGLSLGATRVNADVSVTAIPIVAELGITNELSVGAVFPIVKTRNEVFFQANPQGNEGNVSFNPALFAPTSGARGVNTQLVGQLLTAAAQLEAQVGGCAPGSTTQACQIVFSTRQFAGGVAQIYGINTIAGFPVDTTGSPFVPVAGTDVQLAIAARIAFFDAYYEAALPGDVITDGAAPIASPTVLSTEQAQTILTNPAFGILGEELRTVERSGLGDVELGAKYRFLDTFEKRGLNRLAPPVGGFNQRAAVGVLLRLPTGDPDQPQNFVDVGTGNGQTDIELRGFYDVLWGNRFWTSFIGRYGWQLADEQTMRIFDVPERALTAAYRERQVDRDLGDYFELEALPKFTINKYLGVGAMYLFRRKYEDRYEGVFEVDAATTGYADLTLNAANLNQQTEVREHRVGAGLSFSTIAAYAEGKAPLPFEITYFHFQTVRGFGGNVPKLFSDQVQVRVYAPLWGR